MTGPAFRRLYLLVILLHLVGDVALSPFYPQLFERLFGVTGTAATGTFVWVCRAAALAAMPLWGLAARRAPMRTLVVGALAVAAVLELVLAAAPTYTAFLVLSATQVVVTMAFTLAYPAFVGTGRDRLRDVTLFAYVVNGGVVVATVLGAAVMALPNPRYGIAACALLYVALAVLCHRHLPRTADRTAIVPAAGEGAASGGTGHDGARADGRPVPGAPGGNAPPDRAPSGGGAARTATTALVAVCAAVLAAETARLVVRPFFTLYAEDGGTGTTAAAVLFLLPQATVLAVLPLARRAHALLGRALLPVACLVAALGLLAQFLAPDPLLLALGRVVFGAGLGLGHVALDLRVFEATGARGPAFSAVATVRVGATLVSPVLATALAGAGLGLPLAAGAALFGVLALTLALLPAHPPPTAPEPEPTPAPEPAPQTTTAHRTEDTQHA
ncbi:MFS family permease [Nocardiopsis arvandica]|uniref:MFS family permease n=1 Tax=Nocardiopsis sinuspersici TaxID=501010 RepID=A0A7Y9XGX8_9ACTN|nr:hypothetical protein [Nocardiopsis sinuspersici]NYH55581.1 MFS family permease [Nocardiopsis sinuspersici]